MKRCTYTHGSWERVRHTARALEIINNIGDFHLLWASHWDMSPTILMVFPDVLSDKC